jgi:hypothetical protein
MRPFGGLSDEMVGLCIEQHQNGLDAVGEAPLIGCGSYDLQATCTRFLVKSVNVAHSSTWKHLKAQSFSSSS